MALSDFQTLVTDLVRDDAGRISSGQRDQAIALAVERYSQDRPRDWVEDLAGDGTNYLALPAGWQLEYSQLKSLEYPIGAVPPSLLEQGSWQLYKTPSTTKVMVLSAIPAGKSARATYTIKHVVSAGADTVPLNHRESVACWAAANLCEQLASAYSNSGDSTIQADSVDHKSRAAEFAKRAKGLRQRYLDELGINEKRNVAAGTVVNLQMGDSRGRDRLTHPRRYR